MARRRDILPLVCIGNPTQVGATWKFDILAAFTPIPGSVAALKAVLTLFDGAADASKWHISWPGTEADANWALVFGSVLEITFPAAPPTGFASIYFAGNDPKLNALVGGRVNAAGWVDIPTP